MHTWTVVWTGLVRFSHVVALGAAAIHLLLSCEPHPALRSSGAAADAGAPVVNHGGAPPAPPPPTRCAPFPAERPPDFSVVYAWTVLPHGGGDSVEKVELSASVCRYTKGPPMQVDLIANCAGLLPAELDQLYQVLRESSFDHMIDRPRPARWSPHYGRKSVSARWSGQSCQVTDDMDAALDEPWGLAFHGLFGRIYQVFIKAYERGQAPGFMRPDAR